MKRRVRGCFCNDCLWFHVSFAYLLEQICPRRAVAHKHVWEKGQMGTGRTKKPHLERFTVGRQTLEFFNMLIQSSHECNLRHLTTVEILSLKEIFKGGT